MPTDKEGLPGTIQRSPKSAQRTYAEALDSAHEQYDDEERAHRVAATCPTTPRVAGHLTVTVH